MESNNKFIYILLLLLYVLVWRWPTKVGHNKVSETKDTIEIVKTKAEPKISPYTNTTNMYPSNTLPVLENHGARFREIFKFHLGMKEVPMGSNRGPGVDTLLSYCNLPPGNQWCAATCSKMMGLSNITNPKSGWTPTLVPKDKIIFKSGDSWPLFIKKYQYQLPDMVLIGSLYVAQKKRDGHSFGIAYIVDEYIYSYEGNVNDMMLAKKRHYSTISKICDWTPNESTF